MLTEVMIAVAEKQRLGFVATVSADGTPNVSPKGTFVVVDRHTLAFGEIRSPQTVKNLHANPVVEVNFVDPLARKGFRAKGTGQVCARGEPRFDEHAHRFARWGELAERIRNIVLISVESAVPLSSPVYDDGVSEAELREQWTRTLLGD